MTAPVLSEQDFLHALQSLLPRGRVWPREGSDVQTQFFSSMAPTFKRQADASAALLVDAFPATAVHLLPEWESTLGLPDPCLTANQTTEERQASVVEKLTVVGGQSAPYFIALAEALGYSVVRVKNFAPLRASHSRAGDRCYSENWLFTWLMELIGLDIVDARASVALAGDAIYYLTLGALGCEVRKYAPAHTNVLFGTTQKLAGDDGIILTGDDGVELLAG